MDDLQIQAQFNAEATQALYASSTRALLTSLSAASVLCYAQSGVISLKNIVIWLIINVFTYLLRYSFALAYHKKTRDIFEQAWWLNAFKITTTACGITWGLAAVFLFPANNLAHQAILAACLAGVYAAGIFVYSVEKSTGLVFSLGILVFGLPNYIFSEDKLAVMCGLLVMLFGLYTVIASFSNSKIIKSSILLRIKSNNAQQEIKIAGEKIEQLAYYDTITKLPNRWLFLKKLEEAITLSANQHQYGCTMFIDLDNFKLLNDTKGHAAGDNLLQQVAQRLQGCIRNTDTVARIGGDEFVIILNDLGKSENEANEIASRVATQILEELNKTYVINKNEHTFSASIGIALFVNQTANAEEVLKYADIAMYQAKKAGKNGFHLFDESTQIYINRRNTLTEDLRQAIAKRQLALHYQLQVNAAQMPTGAEALLRWSHPRLGMISPSEFIEIAEQTGQIINIGNWVFFEACQQLKAWSMNNLTNTLRLSVNVSALQFSDDDFVPQVTKAIALSGCNPKLLTLELTESALLQNIEAVIEKMHELKALGLAIAIDDFGVGYSSFSALKRLPVDEIKIDQSFIQDSLENLSNITILKGIVSMGNSLGLKVVAEGVETQAQLRFLASCFCKSYQGYLFSKPVDVEALEEHLRKHEKDLLPPQTSKSHLHLSVVG